MGDGTTSVTVLASELIKEAEKLIEMRIHPQTIIAGWRKAVTAADQALAQAAMDNRSGSMPPRSLTILEGPPPEHSHLAASSGPI